MTEYVFPVCSGLQCIIDVVFLQAAYSKTLDLGWSVFPNPLSSAEAIVSFLDRCKTFRWGRLSLMKTTFKSSSKNSSGKNLRNLTEKLSKNCLISDKSLQNTARKTKTIYDSSFHQKKGFLNKGEIPQGISFFFLIDCNLSQNKNTLAIFWNFYLLKYVLFI